VSKATMMFSVRRGETEVLASDLRIKIENVSKVMTTNEGPKSKAKICKSSICPQVILKMVLSSKEKKAYTVFFWQLALSQKSERVTSIIV
jgi:hypothetical protein